MTLQQLPHDLPGLPGKLGIHIRYASPNTVGSPTIDGSMVLTDDHANPAGTVHAAAIVALADTACGYGCLAALPESASGFTTVELKTNYLGTARTRQCLIVRAHAVHQGSTTHVWDAKVHIAALAPGGPEKLIAVFRCTQMILYPPQGR